MSSKKNPFELGLALSGGGYRAAAFHLGTMRKLHELGLLHRVEALSTVSGGSIVGAAWLLHEGDFDSFEKKMNAALRRSTLGRILRSPVFLIPVILFLVIFGGLMFDQQPVAMPPWSRTLICVCMLIVLVLFHHFFNPLSWLKVRAYKKLFFGEATLEQLRASPKIAINATNLETGLPWIFSRDYMNDSTYHHKYKIFFKPGGFKVAQAVASSTCVPIPFKPFSIQKSFFHTAGDETKVNPRLVDGGIYDNQGIHKLTHDGSDFQSRTVIVSDASYPFSRTYRGANSLFVLSRVMDIMMRRIENLQYVRDLLQLHKGIAYFSLEKSCEECVQKFVKYLRQGDLPPTAGAHLGLSPEDLKKPEADLIMQIKANPRINSLVKRGLSPESIKKVGSIPTNLTALREEDIKMLQLHASLLTEIQICLYCPHLLSQAG